MRAEEGCSQPPKNVPHWRDPAFVEQGPRAGQLPTAGRPFWGERRLAPFWPGRLAQTTPHWGFLETETEEEEKEEEAYWEPLGALLGPPGSFLGASWRPPWASWGPLGGFLGASLAVLGRSCLV